MDTVKSLDRTMVIDLLQQYETDYFDKLLMQRLLDSQDPVARQLCEDIFYRIPPRTYRPVMEGEWPLCTKCNTFTQILYCQPYDFIASEARPGDSDHEERSWLLYDHYAFWSLDMRKRSTSCAMCSFLFREWRLRYQTSIDYRYMLVFRNGRDDFGILSGKHRINLVRSSTPIAHTPLSMVHLKRSQIRDMRSSLVMFSFIGNKPRLGRHVSWTQDPKKFVVYTIGSPPQDYIRPLVHCLVYHTECVRPNQKFLPKRLIDVGDMNWPGRKVRLLETSGQHARYATLSHCWGGKIVHRLLKANREEYLQGINQDMLPKGISDAIGLTRALSIRYIWIDALCIVQDDAQEWEEESLNMAEIYANALLNICNSENASSSDPLMQSHSVAKFSMHSTILGENVENRAWAVGPSYDLISTIRSGNHHLNTRGWTLQERILSPANLHVLHNGLVWECRQACFDKCTGRFLRPHTLLKCLQVGRADMDESPPDRRLQTWARIVENFSARDLTVAGDKLIAIAGIAKHISKVYPGDYLAGVWLQDLPEALLWSKIEDWLTASSTYRAPSWSWASRDGGVQFPIHRNTILLRDCAMDIKVLSAHTESKISQSFGSVISGCLIIEGVLSELDDEQIHSIKPSFDQNRVPIRCFTVSVGKLGWRRWGEDGEVLPDEANPSDPLFSLLLEPTGRAKEYRRVGVLSSDQDSSPAWQRVLLRRSSTRQRIKII